MKRTTIMKNISVALCLLLAGSLGGYAQSDESLKTLLREKAMNLIERDYEHFATLSNAESIEGFRKMFTSDKALVYNDLLGLSDASSMAVGQYVNLLGNASITNKIVHVTNISVVEEPHLVSGKWQLTVAFNKQMSYYNDCGVFFSSREYYDADYAMRAFVVYDESDGSCRINRLNGSIRSLNELPENFFVVKQSEENSGLDQKLFYHRNQLKFNSGRQVIIPGVFDPQGFTNGDASVEQVIPTLDGDCNIVTLNYKLKKIGKMLKSAPSMRVKAHFDLPLGGPLSADGDDVKTSSSGMEFGVDLGFRLFEKEHLRLYGFAGLGLSTTSLELEYAKNDYSFQTDADIDGDQYTRHYVDLKLNQKVSLTELNIPVYLNAEYAFSDDMSAYASVGLRFNMNMSKKFEDNGSSADRVYGIYSGKLNTEDKALEWAEAAGKALNLNQNANGFGPDPDLKNTENVELDGVSGMNLDVLGGVGVRYTIPRTPLTIDLGANMVMGMGEVIKSSENSGQTRFVDNKIGTDLKSTEHVGSLTNMLGSVKRQSFRLSLGLIYNF